MLITKDQYKKERKSYKDWNIWQSFEWWEYQSTLWKDVFSISGQGYLALVIKQDLPFRQNYLQVPKWPLWFQDNVFFKDIIELAKKQWSIFVRIISEKPVNYHDLAFKAKKDQFPKSSLIIDLREGEDEILMQMKQKGRYNIRLAQKKWVKVVEELNSEVSAQIFSELMKDTSKRDDFAWHDKNTYKSMIDNLWDKLKVFIAYFDNEPIAAWIFTFCDEKCVYYYWASSNEYRNLMAPYLLQWEAISNAKEMWYKSYDFLWIAENENNKSDHLYWVTHFKLKFWGEKVTYPDALDIPVNLFKYFLYRFIKLFR